MEGTTRKKYRQFEMMMIPKNETIINGKTFCIETGRMARQAGGASVVQFGDTIVFAAATGTKLDRDIDFFPLTVDYREKTSAAGKFPGGFIKREGRPTTKEILTMRLIDRPIRPLFPDDLGMEISVQSLVLSADQQNDPDVLAINAASTALAVSDVPFDGPIGAVRVGLDADGKFIFFPSHDELKRSRLDMVVAGTRDAVVMVEGSADELPEETVIEGILKAHEQIREIIELQEGLVRQVGKEKIVVDPPEDHSELERRIRDEYGQTLREVMLTEGKINRKKAVEQVITAALDAVSPELAPPELPPPGTPDRRLAKNLFEDLVKKLERHYIVETRRRLDGRQLDEIRPISIEVDYLPRTHGSCIFTRGETQALVVAVLGTGRDEQIVDGLMEEYSEKFMVHYNFPSFCVGETWPNRGPKRREIGHGNLSLRALQAVVPSPENFPYTIRLVSDIMESNGSSSMATVCGGTMALMDAGVKIRQPVAGIAMGLIKEAGEFIVLSDIQGSEDHHGDMDFKVAGTGKGITALQMDIKISGISEEVLARALEQAREGRKKILQEMLSVLDKPRDRISDYAPKIIRMKIDPDKIGLVIGPGGKMIKKIQDETSSTIEVEDDGTVIVWGAGLASAKSAQERIEALTEEVKPGRTYRGKVVSVKDFGCFVEVLPGQEGLVHVSELGDGYVQRVSDVVRVGDFIQVKCIGVDAQGRIKLSKKAADKGKPEAPVSGRS